MKFHLDTAEIFVPDRLKPEVALARTTHLGIAAHQDDLEILAVEPILTCFQQPDRWFTGVVMTDGRGSPRSGPYAGYTDEKMRLVRFAEQRKAAVVGEYAAQIMLDYPSAVVKDGRDRRPVEDLIAILRATHPQAVYTHNLADKHDTHVPVALRVIEAIRHLPPEERPGRLLGCEVWRDLDWMPDEEKVVLDCSSHENLQAALLGVFDSQIVGGKRYDLAAMARRRANATFFESHATDVTTAQVYAMDLTPLITDPTRDVLGYVQELIARFAKDVEDRINRMR